MALGIMGFYAIVFTGFKIKSKYATPEEHVAAPVHVDTSADAVPSSDSPNFGTWLEQPGNFERMLAEL